MLLFLLYGMAVLPFVYLISFAFEVSASGYVAVVLINIVTGKPLPRCVTQALLDLALPHMSLFCNAECCVLLCAAGTLASVAVFVLKFPSLGTMEEAEICEWVFYVLLPNFCFINGLQELFNNYNNEMVSRR